MDFLTSQFGLHQALVLMPWTWPILDCNVLHISSSSVSDLKEDLMMPGYNLCEEVVKMSCTSLEKKLGAIVKANSGHFEL